MSSLFWLFIFGLALAGLLKSSSLLVLELKKLGKGMGVSPFLLGATVLAVSTAFPELLSSLWAVSTQYSSMVSGLVIGSNLANLLLILGASALFTPFTFEKQSLGIPAGLWIGSNLLLGVLLYDGDFTRIDGLIMLAVYCVALHLSREQDRGGFFSSMALRFEEAPVNPKTVLAVAALGVATGLCSYLSVLAVENVSELWNLAPSILGASLLAVGTSLPELILARSSLKTGDAAMALGTVLGSTVLNSTLVMGVPSLFQTLHVTSDVIVLGLPFLLMSTLLVGFTLMQGKLSRHEAMIFLLFFGVFQAQLLTAF